MIFHSTKAIHSYFNWMDISLVLLFLNKFNPKVIFNFYLNIALIAAYFGILQQIGFILGLEYLYDFRWLFIGAADFTFTENF